MHYFCIVWILNILSLIVTDVVSKRKKMGRMLLLPNIFLAFLFIVWIKQCTKTIQKMGQNTKLLHLWINHSICSPLKVSRATSLIIHLLPFLFSFWVIEFCRQNRISFACLFIFYFLPIVFWVHNYEFFLFILLNNFFYWSQKWDFSLYA